MKTKILLLAAALFGSTAIGWGQTATVDGVLKTLTDLGSGSISSAKKIVVEGVWTNAQIQILKLAYKPYSSNSSLQECDMSAATFANEDINMTELFRGCSSLTTVTLPTVQSNNKFNLYGTFYNCTKLTQINNLDKLGTVTSFYGTFNSAQELESITLPATVNDNDNVSCKEAFKQCYKLKNIVNLDKVNKANDFNNAFYYCQVLTSIKLPAGNGGISTDFYYAFNTCKALESVENLDKFTKISNLQSSFQGCINLISVILPENGGTLSFLNTFNGCEKLTGIQNLNKWTANNLNGTFKGCSALTMLEFPSEDNTNSTDFTSTFENCKKLVSIKNFDKFKNITNVSSTFSNCEKLTSVTFSKDLIMPAKGVTASNIFSNCMELTRVENFGKVYLKTDANCTTNMFKMCKKLVYIELTPVDSYPLHSSGSNAYDNLNPNCLIYVTAGKNANNIPTTRNIISGTAAKTDINLTDEMTIKDVVTKCPFFCPIEFSLGDKKITYTRTFNYATPKNGWNTLCLPFDAKLTTATETLPYFSATNGAGRYWAKTYTSSSEVGKVSFGHVNGTDSNLIPANTPCIIALPGAEFGASGIQNETLSFTATGITVKATPEAIEKADANYTLKGNYAIIEKQPMYLLNKGTDQNSDNFALVNAGNLAPFRAYFVANSGPAKVSTLSIDGEGGGTTDLVMAQAEQTKVVTGGKGYIEITASKAERINITAIDGRTVDSANVNEGTTRINVAPGIYIANGEKVIVR